jgi:hypothetical protein
VFRKRAHLLPRRNDAPKRNTIFDQGHGKHLQAAARNIAKAVRLLQDDIENGIQIAGRFVDDFEDFSGRRLLIAGFLQFFAKTRNLRAFRPDGGPGTSLALAEVVALY